MLSKLVAGEKMIFRLRFKCVKPELVANHTCQERTTLSPPSLSFISTILR